MKWYRSIGKCIACGETTTYKTESLIYGKMFNCGSCSEGLCPITAGYEITTE